MKKRWIICAGAVAVLAAILLGRGCRHNGGDEMYDPVTVRRGNLRRMQRETGLLESRDSTPVRSAAEGDLEWVVRDGEWVEPGEKLFIVDVDGALESVAQTRTEMLGHEQALSLERTRRQQAERVENLKIDAAQRNLELATIRHRILSTPPKRGRRIIEIHEALLPLEEETAGLRERYEIAQNAFQAAQDTYLEQLDRVLEKKDGIVYQQTKADEQRVRLQALDDADTDAEREQMEKARKHLEEAEATMARFRRELPAAEAVLADTKRARDEAQAPRDRLQQELAAREADQKELYIRLEIEKRGVAGVQLELERDMALLKKQEAERKHKEGQVAFSTGAISELQLEKLADALAAERNNLLILEEKLAIAKRPEPEEVLTEARLQMEQAEVRAQKARDLRDRALRMIDQKITVLKARIERSSYEVEAAMRAFPEVLEFSITFLKEEIQGLDDSPEGIKRRGEIEASIAKLERDLVAARESPPNVGTSPFAGIVRLMHRHGRPVQTGDGVDRESVVAHVYPGTNLEVRAYLNETAFGTVAEGMDVEIIVPSLQRQRFPGTVTHASRVGKDKFDGRGSDAWAGVTQFELRVRLNRSSDALRPGMTAIVECEVDMAEDVLYLPREAVFQTDGGYRCLQREPGGRVVERRVSGRAFSGTAFVIDDGLAEGDTVVIRRRRSS